MLGSVIAVPNPGSQGQIAGDDGNDYWFTEAGWRDPFGARSPGVRVEFQARGQRGTDVHPQGAMVAAAPVANQGGMPPARWPVQGQGQGRSQSLFQGQGQSQLQAQGQNFGGGGAPPSPQAAFQPGTRGQGHRGRGRGSMPAAMRSMSMVFLLTPLAIPMLLLLPLIGRLELLLMTLAPGFLGGMKAGGVKRAMAAAVMVGVMYGAVHYLMVLALLHSMAGLMGLGSYVQALVDFFGGLGTATALVTVAITAPFILALIFSALAGALAAKARGKR